MSDVQILDQGTLIGFQPVSEAAKEWFEHNVASEDWQWFGNTLWVDHRPARDLALELIAEGLDLKVQR